VLGRQPGTPSPRGRGTRGAQDREIIRLAVPAFFALVAEPLFLLADSAIVGHLGVSQLAALGVAWAVLTTLVSLCVFLAYGTTAAVARKVGAGDLGSAIRQGVDGIWLAIGIGAAVTTVGVPVAPAVVDLFGASAEVTPYAVTYLRIALLAAPAMLVVLAATGVLRGLQDTVTPLVVATFGAVVNVILNLLLVYGVGLGIAGSAWGTVLTQFGCAAAFIVIVVRGARRHGAPLRPDLPGIRASATAGVPLLVRTLTLRTALLAMTVVAATQGAVALAANQVAFALWALLAFALDAIAIAGQAIVGRSLGASDAAAARAATTRMVQWGIAAGILLGALLIVLRPAYVPLFSPDDAVRDLLSQVLLVAAIFQPVCGVVFVLDGVLIGAGDGRYLAWAGVLTLVVFLPLAALVVVADAGLVALWWAFNAFMLARLVTLVVRERGDAWLVTGGATPTRLRRA
jgi:putative MATE family efflux protein